MASRTHPHIDSPSDDELGRVVESKKPAVREVYLAVHRLVLKTVPGVACSVDCVDGQIGYGARQFGYDGWGMAALAPFTNWVSLAFLRGARLEDPDGLLEGTGAGVRHVKLRSIEQLTQTEDAVRRLLEQAVRLEQG
jgi:hypothetical protein